MATFDLVVPFLNDSRDYACGVEFGMLYARMKTEDQISDFILTDNQEQVTLLVNRTGWIIDKMDLRDGGWVWVEMHRL